MHVVDAVATYRPSVVAEVILNGWVPHLKFRREQRRSSLCVTERTGIGAQTLDLGNTPGHLLIIQQSEQLLLKNEYPEPRCFNTGSAFPVS